MNYQIIDKLTNEQIEELHELFQQEWWTKGRSLKDIKKMIKHSDIIIGICESNSKELIGFLRIITDFTYKALVLDVIVNKTYRCQNLGTVLINKIFEHPLLDSVGHFELYCRPEIISFYKRSGFSENLGDLIFMRKDNSV